MRQESLTVARISLPANHPCTLACHAPAACDESEPCRAPITLSCPCGRIKQQVPCGRSATNPQGLEGSQQLKCSTECLVAKRNARLAEALGINADARSKEVVYSPELLAHAKLDVKFCHLVEKTFAECVRLTIPFENVVLTVAQIHLLGQKNTSPSTYATPAPQICSRCASQMLQLPSVHD